jgi:hypothetical protein
MDRIEDVILSSILSILPLLFFSLFLSARLMSFLSSISSSKQKKGTKGRRKQGKVVAKIHQRTSSQPKDFCHKVAKKIVDRYQYICVEDLDIKKMIDGSFLAKSITD